MMNFTGIKIHRRSSHKAQQDSKLTWNWFIYHRGYRVQEITTLISPATSIQYHRCHLSLTPEHHEISRISLTDKDHAESPRCLFRFWNGPVKAESRAQATAARLNGAPYSAATTGTPLFLFLFICFLSFVLHWNTTSCILFFFSSAMFGAYRKASFGVLVTCLC